MAVLPYRLAEYTHHVYPAKLNEYLAMGLGVVATPLAEIEQFNQTHGDIVQIGADAEAFGRAIMSVLGDDGRAQIARRVAVARANGWGVRLEQMSNLIDGVLERLVSSESCVASQAS